ncbi:unnamed protein product [Meloidogyne enterolobii]|uniref:Uncharacterized protein n=1 Tax=Meloidogyne enterolobii TaxID=390850 RepID=A0ACB1B2K5_MELEN
MILRYFIRQNLKLQLCSTRNYVPEYNKRKTGWILRKANGYLARHPNFFNNFIVYGFTGFMAGYWFYNSYQEKKIKKTMTEEEYIMYREKKKALNEQRMKYGFYFFGEYFLNLRGKNLLLRTQSPILSIYMSKFVSRP